MITNKDKLYIGLSFALAILYHTTLERNPYEPDRDGLHSTEIATDRAGHRALNQCDRADAKTDCKAGTDGGVHSHPEQPARLIPIRPDSKDADVAQGPSGR